MRKITLFALFATSLAVSAPAAVTAGFEAGYLTDNKDAYWAARVGWALKTSSALSHQVELEFGYTEHAVPVLLFTGPSTMTSKLTPIMINYRAEIARTDKLGYYFGAGLGQSRVSFSMPGSGVPTISARDTTTAVQAFAGLSYKTAPAATLQLGVKYLWIDEAKFLGLNTGIGNDLALTASVSFKF